MGLIPTANGELPLRGYLKRYVSLDTPFGCGYNTHFHVMK